MIMKGKIRFLHDIKITYTNCGVSYTHTPSGLYKLCIFKPSDRGITCISEAEHERMLHNLEKDVNEWQAEIGAYYKHKACLQADKKAAPALGRSENRCE